ncbi:hypothetical protein GGF32_004329 [Allomyces javanicus]|nr:hypothetical protein GGF32_004329 [Allomyces javanicus]
MSPPSDPHRPCAASDIAPGIDLTSLAARLRRLPTPLTNVDLVLREYRRFLALRVAHRDEDGTLLAPSAAVERVWHVHVLDTRGYVATNRAFPVFVHYAEDDDEDEEDRARRLANTRTCYRARTPSDCD